MSDTGGYSGSEPQHGRAQDLRALPEIRSVYQTEITFEEPRIEYEGLERVEYGQAVAFDVVTDGPFLGRALGPAVFVGETALTNMDEIEPNHYRFYAFDAKELEAGARVSVGWVDSEPERRVQTELVYGR